MSFMRTRAKEGDAVDNDGVMCGVKSITVLTMTTGGNPPDMEWSSRFMTYCGQLVDTPVRADVKTLTCLMCLAEKGN